MKKTIITIVFLFIATTLMAQKITIQGTVKTSNTKEPLIASTVTIFNAKTNAFIGYAYVDENGEYVISFEKTAIYVKAELLGYKNYTSATINPTKNTIELNILLDEEATELEEVVILQKKKLMRLTGDKMIVDVDKSGIGVGSDALQTLSKLPGMRLDKDENIVFRGNPNMQILINGKPSLISGDELKQFLKTLDGEEIKNVEIIANPSAKYSAAGSGGILNIRLKKSINTGLTGNIRTSIGYGEFFKNSNGINLYNNTEKWNLNFGFNKGYNKSANHRKIIQTIVEPTKTTRLEQLNDWIPESNNYSGNFGVSRQLNPNSSIGSAINYSSYKSDENTIGRTNEFYNNSYDRYTLLNTNNLQEDKTLTGNVYYTYASTDYDTKIDAQINFANYKRTSDRITSNSFFDANTNTMYQSEKVVKNENPTTFNIFSSKLDVEKKLSKTMSIESGLRYSYVNNDYTILLKDKNANGDFITNTNRSNHLLYKESILAGYGIANFNTEKWNFQTGLRVEHISYDATSKTTNSSNTGNYTSFFPSFSVNGNFDNNQYKFSYSKRIERPRYLYLNPFFEYIDTYNVQVGNPNLTPAFTNAFELTWIRKQKTSFSLFANFTKDEMYQIINYDENTKITTLYYDNIGASKSIGLSFNTSFEATKWWEIQLNSEISYGQAKSDLANYIFNNSGTNFYGNINQSFTLKNDLSFTWSSFYSNQGSYGNSTFKPSYDMSFGMRKSFLNKKLHVNISAQNVLKESQWRQVTTQNNVTTNWTNQWETRKFTLSLTYNFGSGKKNDVKATDLSKEQNRL